VAIFGQAFHSMACSACADLRWDLFKSSRTPLYHHSIRVRSTGLADVIAAKKNGCQPCFAVYRAIELHQGLGGPCNTLESRLFDWAELSRISFVRRSTGHPVEVIAFIKYKRPPTEHSAVKVALEIFTDPGESQVYCAAIEFPYLNVPQESRHHGRPFVRRNT
jgi:hypothetical protein